MESVPPWGSKTRVNRTGDAFRQAQITQDVVNCLDSWRRGHRYILNTFQSILRNKTKGTNIIVTQRLKRKITIIDKLRREPHMQLSRMDDVAGCRLIFSDIEALETFRNKFHKSNFKHKRKNDIDKYNYIKKPKPLGYRGIHDIYEYNANSKKAAKYKGLLLEVQYRTQCQHAWATCVELVTHFTGHEPKFNRGDIAHIEFFKLASEIIARANEELTSCHSELTNRELIEKFNAADKEINLMKLLRDKEPSREGATDSGVFLLQITKDKSLKVHEFSDQKKATEAYFKFEIEFPNDDIVLVSGDTFADIRTSYKNYFSDVKEFVKLIDDGIGLLKN